jgi:hypothetical protein
LANFGEAKMTEIPLISYRKTIINLQLKLEKVFYAQLILLGHQCFIWTQCCKTFNSCN